MLPPTWPMFSATLSPKMGTLLCEWSARQERGSLPMCCNTCAIFSASVFPIMGIRLGCPTQCSLLLCSKHVQRSPLSLFPYILLRYTALSRCSLFSAAASPKIDNALCDCIAWYEHRSLLLWRLEVAFGRLRSFSSAQYSFTVHTATKLLRLLMRASSLCAYACVCASVYL